MTQVVVNFDGELKNSTELAMAKTTAAQAETPKRGAVGSALLILNWLKCCTQPNEKGGCWVVYIVAELS